MFERKLAFRAFFDSNAAPLLLHKPAIFLETAIPTSGFHAVRLARPAIGHTGGKRRLVRILLAFDDAKALFAAAAHGHGGRLCGVEQKQTANQRPEDYAAISGHRGFIPGGNQMASCQFCRRPGNQRQLLADSRRRLGLLRTPAIDT
jgi:hypothetical protein